MQKKPKQLWYASLVFKQSGRWLATQDFYLGKPYKPEIPMKYKCHVLYESPMEAFLSLHKEIGEFIKKHRPFKLSIFIYSVNTSQVFTKANWFDKDKISELELFTSDRDLLPRYLIRQALVFQRAGNLEIPLTRFSKEPLLDISFKNKLDKDVHLMTIRKPEVTQVFGLWSKYMCKAVEEGLFNFNDYPFLAPVTIKPKESINAA